MLKGVEGDVVEAIHIVPVVLWVPSLPVIPKNVWIGGDECCLGRVPWVDVVYVVYPIVVVVQIEVVLDAIRVEIAWPYELVDSPIVVIVLVVGAPA